MLSIIRLARTVDGMTYSPADNRLTFARVTLDVSPATAAVTGTSYAGAFRDVVYDNPTLLPGDYGRTTILVDTPARALLPFEVTDSDLQLELLRHGDADGLVPSGAVLYDTPLESVGVRMVMALDPELANYLRRTYTDATVTASLTPLLEYFAAKSRLSADMQCYVNLRPDSDGTLDILIMQGGVPRLANTYPAPADADALYFILAACEAARFTIGADSTDTVSLCGDRVRRGRLMVLLRERRVRVVPVIFPPAIYRAGRDAADVPFDMVAAAVM